MFKNEMTLEEARDYGAPPTDACLSCGTREQPLKNVDGDILCFTCTVAECVHQLEIQQELNEKIRTLQAQIVLS